MKIVVEVEEKNINKYIENGADAVILGLKNYAVGKDIYFDIDEIEDISKNITSNIFVLMNKNFFNDELDGLKEVLDKLNCIDILGVIFYDISLLKLKQDNNYSFDLVWGQEHMTTNYNTCNYYFEKGVKYVDISREITLDEVLEIKKMSKIFMLVNVFGKNNVSYTRRKLISNYNDYFSLPKSNKLNILEKVSGQSYTLLEEDDGVVFYSDAILNGLGIIDELQNSGVEYIVFNEFSINHDVFLELINDTKEYLLGKIKKDVFCKYNTKFGEDTNFLFKKSIFKVKKQ